MDRSFDEGAVEILERTTLHHHWLRVDRFRLRHRRFAGGWTAALDREILVRGEIAVVLPYDPERDEIVLVEQFRLPAFVGGGDAWQIEPVAGMVDPGEGGPAAARRELAEEAGLACTALVEACRYFPSPGGNSQRMHFYLARVDTARAGGLFGMAAEDEDIQVHILPVARAFELLDAGRFQGGPTLIALLWLARHRERLRAEWLAADRTADATAEAPGAGAGGGAVAAPRGGA
ncbi:MAG: NUDIX domain-containing protein [Tistlia sp.]|uniref:NUDIX domain-containing protein n=1 Tax=Tistlia sp. TaxID=3057121 RepID=UPI0034A3C493